MASLTKSSNGCSPTLFAFAILRDPISRDYYTRKIQQGKRHNQALIALARRRCNVLFAMLRDSAFYQAQSAPYARQTT